MTRPELTKDEKAERLYGRRSQDRPEMARIFCAPFAAHVWGMKQPAQTITPNRASPYAAPTAQITGRLLNRLA